MYSNPYEEYMRNSLGYNQMPSMNMNQMNPMAEMYESEGNFTCDQTSVDDMYPEIYRIVYPMICKACMSVNENVTEDLVSRITNEVYTNVEHTEVAQENRSAATNISTQTNKNLKNDSLNNRTTSSSSVSNVRQETRQRNPLLRDLIRILVLRELIGNPGRSRPQRPPFRPPFGGGFGPGPRPPYMF